MSTYAERPWVKLYDEGVPESLEPYPDIGLHELLQQKAAEDPNRQLLITSVRLPLFGRRSTIMTLGQLDRASDAMSAALIDMGLKKGDRVAIVLPNCAASPITPFSRPVASSPPATPPILRPRWPTRSTTATPNSSSS
jgi:long-chain acyl-CoA synthetase